MPADQPTPTEQLRAAATKMRERANAATPGRWTAAGLFAPAEGCRCLSCTEDEPWAWEVAELDGPDSGDCIHPMHIRQADAEHIATAADPATMLGLADLLDSAATAWPIDHSEPPRNPRDRQMAYAAINVARSYLGTTEQVAA